MTPRHALLPITMAFALSGMALQAQISGAAPSQPNLPLPASATPDQINLIVNPNPVPNAQVTGTPQEPEGSNGIRFVRLSQANGKVSMDRQTGLGFEDVVANFPIVQGALLKTSEGAAEVEFEDGSTLRLVPNTQVTFSQLRRDGDGNTLTTIRVSKGTVYASTARSKGNTFTLTSGGGRFEVKPKSHLRLEVGNPETRLSVITGDANFVSGVETHDVGKMKSLIFNTDTNAPADLVAGIEDAAFDGWDMHMEEYHQQYAKGKALAGSGAVYGLDDLNYYGAFTDIGDCGRVWRPYFASAAWDPYDNGIWAYYPGAGYSWVSPYPWGWAPFHYGSWVNCGVGGWGWAPGGNWRGIAGGHSPWRNGDHRHHHDPTHVHPYPPRPQPAPGKANSMIAVNQKPLNLSHANRWGNNFEFRRDSAGLGIPRGEFGNLRNFSKQADSKGSANLAITAAPLPPSTGVVRAGGTLSSSYRPGSNVHPGYFHRPDEGMHGGTAVASGAGSAGRSTGNNPAHDGPAAYAGGAGREGTASTGYKGPSTAASGEGNRGYSSGNSSRGSSSSGYSAGNNGGGYSGGSHPDGSSNSASGGGGYSGGSHGGSSGGGYSGGGGGYSGGSHGGSSSSGGGYSGGGGGGFSGGGHSAPSAPAPSAPAPSAPAPSAPASTGHR